MSGEKINVCPRCGEPVVFTFEFTGVEYYCVCCEWMGGVFAQARTDATPELAARSAELSARYDRERAEREGRPAPEPRPEGSRPTCGGCGKFAEGPLDGDKPAHWYSRTIDGRTEYACSTDCITEGSRLPW